jgi:uncharacterized protein (DUF934 family)
MALLIKDKRVVANPSSPDAGEVIRLASSDDPASVAGRLAGAARVEVEFPKFGDGRGYSIGRLLRTRYGYRGEMRAVGALTRDHLWSLAQVGFDAFELREGEDAEAALAAFDDFSTAYQK